LRLNLAGPRQLRGGEHSRPDDEVRAPQTPDMRLDALEKCLAQHGFNATR